jgi:hypothetical protein
MKIYLVLNHLYLFMYFFYILTSTSDVVGYQFVGSIFSAFTSGH